MRIHSVHRAVTGPTPMIFSHLDLRFFRKIEMSDDFPVETNPTDGIVYEAILYGRTVIGERTRSVHDSDAQAVVTGLHDAFTMYGAANLYAQIVRTAHMKYERHDTAAMSAADPDWDTVPDGAEVALLKTHPQFKHDEQAFGIGLEPITGRDDVLRVKVWKHRDQT